MSKKPEELQTALAQLPTDPPDIDQAMARARLLLALERPSEAREIAERWHERAANDARPLVVLARCQLFARDDVERHRYVAQDYLDEASQLEGRDGDYYGLLIGLKGYTLIQDTLRASGDDSEEFFRLLGERMSTFRSLAADYARFQPGRAAILAFVIDLADGVLKLRNEQAGAAAIYGTIHDRAAEARTLAQRHSDEGDAYQLSLAAATLDEDPHRALAAVAARPPLPLAEAPELYLLQARMQVGLAAFWRRPAEARAALKILESLPVGEGRQAAGLALLRGDAHALIGHLAGDRRAWQQAEASYRSALGELPAAAKGRALNNLAMVLSKLDRPGEAIARWQEAAALPDLAKAWVPRLNLLVQRRPSLDVEKITAELVTLAGEMSRANQGEIPLQITLWQAAVAKQGALPEDLLASARAEWQRIVADKAPPEPRWGEDGLIHETTANLQLSTAARSPSYLLSVELVAEPWLVFASPTKAASLGLR